MPDFFPAEVPFKESLTGFVDTYEDVQDFMRWLSETRDILAVDTETTGFDPYAPGARIRLCQFGDVNAGWTIDAVKWPGLCQHVLNTYQGEIVFHNIDFDARWIIVHWPEVKFPWSRCHDTMLYQKIWDNEAPAGLKPLGVKYYGHAADAGQRMLDAGMTRNKWTWATVPLDFAPYSQYAALDCVLTARIFRKLHEVHSGKFKRVAELEMHSRRICTNMSLRGMRIDAGYCKSKSIEMDKYVNDLKKYCDDVYHVDIGSTTKLGKYFTDIEEALRVDRGDPDFQLLTQFTATGKPQMNKEVLEHLAAEGYDLASHAVDARQVEKINNTYLKNFIKFGENDGGIVHHQIQTMAARTGRMSIKDPALQTLPKGDKTVRRAVIAHEGQVILTSDLDQVEFRLISALAQDNALIERFRQADSIGPDVFTQIGREVFEDPTMEKADARRATMKTMIYARLYGAGLERQAASAGIPVSRMKVISDSFDAMYPDLKRFQEKVGSTLQTMARSGERPYVETYTGRRLYVAPDRTYAGINYLVQSTASEVMKYNLIDLDMSGLSDAMLCPVHDEVICSVDPGDVEEARQTIKECMTTDEEFEVSLPADCSEAMDSWGDS